MAMTFHSNRTAKSWNGRSALAQQHPHRDRTVEMLKQVQNLLTEMFDGLALQRGDQRLQLLHRQAVIRSGVVLILFGGIYTLYRENIRNIDVATSTPMPAAAAVAQQNFDEETTSNDKPV